MRNLFFTSCLLLIFSCSQKENSSSNGVSIEPNSAVYQDISGDQIIENLDCSGCHSATERMIGPSYQEIADKYSQKDVDLLASKIIEGGSGVWGSVPMQPHPQVSKEDAKKIVGYILTMKK